ncbi:MAG: carbohydrate kinase family protein [Candidatus Diapherotrites archaeon]|nr:carbohydrate kinase family protein [Candidatus Diapherotrites archaeon]
MPERKAPRVVFIGRLCYDLHTFDTQKGHSLSTIGGDIAHSVIATRSVFPEERVGIITNSTKYFLGEYLFKNVDMRTFSLSELPSVRFKDFKLIEPPTTGEEIDIPKDFLSADIIAFGYVHPRYVEHLRRKYNGKIIFSTKKQFILKNIKDVINAIRHSDIIILNEEEQKLIGQDPVEMSHNGKIIVITRGKNGATVYHKNTRIDVPAYPVKEAGAIGAGDAFKAILSVSLAKNKPLKEALALASATASFFAEDPIHRRIDKEELAKRYEYILEKVRESHDKNNHV